MGAANGQGVISQAANIANTGMQGANQALTGYPQPQGGGVGIDSTVSDTFPTQNYGRGMSYGAGLGGLGMFNGNFSPEALAFQQANQQPTEATPQMASLARQAATGTYAGTGTTAAPSNMVNRAYGDLFGRSPDAGGAASWGAHLANGMAPSEMLYHMSNSPEFQTQQDYSRGYTSVFRPGYKEFGPNGQYYQPIYQPQYQNYMQPMGGAFGGYGMPMGGGMRGMGGMMQGLGMPSRGDSPIPPAPSTVPSNISQSGGIGSGGALNFTYAEGGIADLLNK